MPSSERESLEMSLDEFLDQARANPLMCENAAARVYRRVFLDGGFTDARADDPKYVQLARAEEMTVGETFRIFHAFADFFGRERILHEIALALEAAGNGAELDRQFLVWIGEPGTGKSALAARFHQRLKDAPIWSLKGCPMHEHPFRLLPFNEREQWARELNVPIHPTADICARCRLTFYEEIGKENWKQFPVVQRKIGARQENLGVGYAVMLPADPMNEDLSELIGRPNIAMLDSKDFPEGHPETLLFNGLFHHGEQGILEVREIFKRNVQQLNMFIFATQDKQAYGPGNYGLVSTDFVIIGHSNMSEYRRFLAEPTNEALKDRREPFVFRHLLRWSAEAQVYEKELARTAYQDAHKAPRLLETLARYAVMTRMKQGQQFSIDTKLAVYNGDVARPTPSEIRRESPEDGTRGLSSRFFTKALGTAYAMAQRVAERETANGAKPCLMWPELSRLIVRKLENEDLSRQELDRCLGLLHKIDAMYVDALRDIFVEAIIGVQEAYTDNLFHNYVLRARRWVALHDENTNPGAIADLEAELLHFERSMDLTPEESTSVREEVVRLVDGARPHNRAFRWQDHPRLKTAVESHLLMRIADLYDLPEPDAKDPDRRKYADRIREALEGKHGYCSRCSERVLAMAASNPEAFLRA